MSQRQYRPSDTQHDNSRVEGLPADTRLQCSCVRLSLISGNEVISHVGLRRGQSGLFEVAFQYLKKSIFSSIFFLSVSYFCVFSLYCQLLPLLIILLMSVNFMFLLYRRFDIFNDNLLILSFGHASLVLVYFYWYNRELQPAGR